MVETGEAPTDEPWDRSEYDVRYYLVSTPSSTDLFNTYFLGSGRLQPRYLDCRRSTSQLGPSSRRQIYQNHRWSGIVLSVY
jgi:hypothetical protein